MTENKPNVLALVNPNKNEVISESFFLEIVNK